MLGADNLFLLERKLDEMNNDSPSEVARLRNVFKSIYSLPEYQEWLADGQYHPAIGLKGRFSLPNMFGKDLGSDKWLLQQLGLLNGSLLEVKIDSCGDSLHITDGSWVDPKIRVYPFTDESALICNYVSKNSDIEYDLLIDPACGCGHHGMGIKNIPLKACLDINLRAIAYCRLNAILTESPQMLCGLNDLRDGIPDIFNKISVDQTLVAINMPFAIFPLAPDLPRTLAQDGGDRGAALTFSAISAVEKLVKHASCMKSIRCVSLFYSLGNQEKDQWEVVEYAKKLFGDDSVSFQIFRDEKMWRVNGKKEQMNPMDLEYLKLKADCRHTYEEREAESARIGYKELESTFRDNGFTHLAYGILDIKCK
jgi:hypothetical protein